MKRRAAVLSITTAAGAGVVAAIAVSPGSVDAASTSAPSLRLYDSAGDVITSGSETNAPVAAYVQAQSCLRSGDSRALLTISHPDGSTAETLSAVTSYPNPAAPSALAKSPLPLVTGGSGDTTLSSYVAKNGTAPQYELRLYTGAGSSIDTSSSAYAAADITIDTAAQTWSLVSTPGTANPDSCSTATTTAATTTATGTTATTATTPTTLTTAPANDTRVTASAPTSIHYGTSYKLSVAVASTGADLSLPTPTGQVTVSLASRQLAHAPLNEGTAEPLVSGYALMPGRYTLTVAYPGSDTAAASQTTQDVTVAKAVPRFTTTLPRVRRGRGAKLAVRVKGAGHGAPGRVFFTVAGRSFGSQKLSATGRATLSIPARRRTGRFTVAIRYGGSPTVAGARIRRTLVVTR